MIYVVMVQQVTTNFNGTSLANSTQVYSAAGCGTLSSGTRYFSQDNAIFIIYGVVVQHSVALILLTVHKIT
jgi:hypothetical protein